MKTNRRNRKTPKLSHVRWTSYAIAAGATAVAGTPTAEAEIHYSGLINFKFDSRGSETHTFPLSQGAVLEGFRETAGFYEHSATFAIKGAAVSNALRVYKYSTGGFFHSVVKPLPRGSVVSQGYFNRFGLGFLQYYNCGFPGWQDAGTHAIGFRFNSGHGKQYGWVRIKFAGCGFPADNKFTVRDYAWGDPGDQIRAGQTHLQEDETQIVPPSAKSTGAPLSGSQGSLGLLALGAVGLQAWRRSRRGDEHGA